jgi:chemotaxis protein MotA
MSIEADVDFPYESALFSRHPKVLADHHAIEFMTDYLRLMVGGNLNAIEIENLMIMKSIPTITKVRSR